MKTGVLVVDDSPLIRAILREAFERTSDLCVVGEAADGDEAIAKVVALRPDIVTMDVAMPKLDGLAATKAIMDVQPTPILVIARDGGNTRSLAVAALGHGALGVFPKTAKGFDEEVARELAELIRRMVRESRPARRAHQAAVAGTPPPSSGEARLRRVPDSSRALIEHRARAPEVPKISIIGVVGSTGAPRTLRELVGGLPKDFPVPMVLVQHTERGFAETLTAWLASVAKLSVVRASAGHVLVPGEIVVAPDDLHVEVATGGIVHLQAGESVDGFRPSGTVLLSSLARSYGAHAMGLVLSGMGMDGAEGLAAIEGGGGCPVVEDPHTAAVPGMPGRALARAQSAWPVPAARLAGVLMDLAGVRPSKPI